MFHQEHIGKIEEVPDCRATLARIREQRELHLITFRSPELHGLTHKLLEELFPDVFHRVDLCGYNMTTAIALQTKVELCLERGIRLMIEDSLPTALDCAEAGIYTLLHNAPWNQTRKQLPERVIRVHGGWSEVEELLTLG
jgi:uncharacterized HAD superfamily protein